MSGEKNGTHYAIVADGCSSSPYTDWGSRILVKAAEESLDDFSLTTAQDMCRFIGLNEYALDSTLLIAQAIDDEVSVEMYGDGAVAFIYQDYISIKNIFYPSGAPLYLNYLTNKDRMEAYKKETGLERYIESIHIRNNIVTTFDEYIPEDPTYIGYHYTANTKDLIAVAVMSDGIDSFIKPEDTETSRSIVKVHTPEVVDELLGFKNYNGVFVQRRIQKFLKECEKKQWKNTDDVSVAAIYLGG